MAPRRARTKDLARGGHFETFCDRLAGLAASDRLRHRARKIAAADRVTTSYLQLRARERNCFVNREDLLSLCAADLSGLGSNPSSWECREPR
jgi:hypothetical protein